jgi:DHA2 family multidrug resistance protein-like MFS transporter
MPSETAGVMTGFLLLILTISSPLVGWLGDRLGHRLIFTLGVLAIGLSAFIAMLAPDLSWMYLAFGLAGFANAANFTTILAMTLEFGSEIERPLYVGLSNTLTAPILLAAPLIGGFLVDAFNFEIMFLTAFTAAIIAVLLLQFAVKDPRRLRAALPSVGAGN